MTAVGPDGYHSPGGGTGSEDETLLRGTAISPGLAEGRAFVYRDILQRDREWKGIDAEQVAEEQRRIDHALSEVAGHLHATAARVEQELNREVAEIFLAQEAILRDESLVASLREEIEHERVCAETVVKRVFERWARRFRALPDPLISQRADDLVDLGRRTLRVLEGIQAHVLEDLPAGSVVVARRLLPSDTVYLSRRRTVGVVVEQGGRGSHAALLTRELGIPAVSQVPDLLDQVPQGATLLVDGDAGTVTIHPGTRARQEFRARLDDFRSQRRAQEARGHEAARTREGVEIPVMANVGCREDVEDAMRQGADGIGLYRVESLYLCHGALPDVDELHAAMAHALEPARGQPIHLRLLDIGGDKELPFLSLDAEPDPFLGRRGIRLLRAFPDLLDTQLRALVRLCGDFDVRILVPMVTLLEELAWVRERLEWAAAGERVDRSLPLGAMIETPAAALCAGSLAAQAEFLSIGTNDLTQYTMAAGRENPLVADYFQDDHPAVLHLIRHVCAHGRGRGVSVCGELAGKESAVPALVAAGVRALSVAPSLVPAIKEAVRGCAAQA